MTDQSNPPKPPLPSAATRTRATRRQATSYMAFRGEALDPDDPLLAFAPVPHKAPRRNSISPARQRAFIAHLAATGIVAAAARHIGASLEALYRLRHKAGGEAFSAAWDLAVDRGVQRIEDGALARAIEGVEKPIVSGGKLLGWYRVHNEALVTFFLRQRRAKRYGKDHEVGPGHPVYDRVEAEYREEQRRYNSDPKRVAEIHKSIDIKVAEWRRELEKEWEAERQAWIAEHDGEIPHIDSFPDGARRKEPSPEEAEAFYQSWTREDED